MSVRILAVQDERALAGTITRWLRRDGFAVEIATTAAAGLDCMEKCLYDALLLDAALPDLDGVTMCKQIRARDAALPILLLSASASVGDRVRGLDAGADDCLVRPFAGRELAARVRALLRRQGSEALRPMIVGSLALDRLTRRVTRAGRRIDLTAREFTLLEYLMRHAGTPLSRARIAEHVWGRPWTRLTNVIDVFISHLRKRFDRAGEPRLLVPVRGVGYVLRRSAVDDVSASQAPRVPPGPTWTGRRRPLRAGAARVARLR
jgi:DNA-binding response OmpR family regulator